MRHSVVGLVAMVTLAGCAGTRQASVEPVTPPVAAPLIAADTAPVRVAESVSPAVGPESSSGVDAMKIKETTSSVANTSTNPVQPQTLDPFRFLMAWAGGIQQALTPWTQAAQACDTRVTKH